jgi:hypothetical protein
VPVVSNPYFPLPRGRTWVYRGVKDGVTQVDRVHVTGRTMVIEGITATAVTDVSTHRGRVLERTTDWYAQDKRGNVWYLGERTAEHGGDPLGRDLALERAAERGGDRHRGAQPGRPGPHRHPFPRRDRPGGADALVAH